MKAGQKSGIHSYVNDIEESKYASLKREPLGKTINRKYNMPADAQS